MRKTSNWIAAASLLVLGMVFPGMAFSQGAEQSMGPMVDVNLYATLEFENFKDSDSFFGARNVELLVSGQLHPRLTGFTEIEIERSKAAG
jgi:hypothetical protein